MRVVVQGRFYFEKFNCIALQLKINKVSLNEVWCTAGSDLYIVNRQQAGKKTLQRYVLFKLTYTILVMMHHI